MTGQIPDHRPSAPPPGWKATQPELRTAYVARRPCGCFQGFALVETKQQMKDAAKFVAMWIRDGNNVDRLQLKSDEFIDTSKCTEHTKK